LIRGVQSGGEEKAVRLASLRKALRNPETQLTFIKYNLKTNTKLTPPYLSRPIDLIQSSAMTGMKVRL